MRSDSIRVETRYWNSSDPFSMRDIAVPFSAARVFSSFAPFVADVRNAIQIWCTCNAQPYPSLHTRFSWLSFFSILPWNVERWIDIKDDQLPVIVNDNSLIYIYLFIERTLTLLDRMFIERSALFKNNFPNLSAYVNFWSISSICSTLGSFRVLIWFQFVANDCHDPQRNN